MKRVILLIFASLSLLCASAQSAGDKFRTEAEKALADKDYIKARFLFLKAYEGYVNSGKADEAVPCAVNAAALYHRENYYKEAFEKLFAAENMLNQAEQASGKVNAASHYPLARERQKIYVKLRKPDSAADQLARMKTWAEQARDSLITLDFLTASAQQYYQFGQTDKGDAAVNQLIALYEGQQDYDNAEKCYKDLLDVAVATGNPRLITRSYEKYISWADSVAMVKSDARVAAIQHQLDQANADIEDRDSSLTAKTAIIVGLCILAAILAAALVIGGIILMRYIALSRRQKKQIATAQAHNDLKTRFISNIFAQMEPTLSTLPAEMPAVKALRSFTANVQELSGLEASLSSLYPTESVDVTRFANELAEEVKPLVANDVKVIVDAAKINVPIAEPELKQVMTHLLKNAARFTPAEGKITIEVKKRGPHIIQFLVSNTGERIPAEKQADIFKPFTEVRDLTKGDGLGLPICSLMVQKMNGKIRVDETYTPGTRFIIELHP
ncbi:MAG: ATP-binding protein [Bacteroidales bacterium]|nr:ATP-binding protein [Bacteroidales bacterium]MBD5359284.1 ATP-binding protein [Bacteroides sp.]MBD5362302.1 ATP-binding protein [Bacteroides sp.]MBD5371768.1 ATP-binding protein [Bacteroides sp.]